MKNCWKYALEKLIERDGWLILRNTRRSSSKNRYTTLGNILLYIGVTLFNWGLHLRTGRWLHAYHADSIKGPYTSYEPKEDKLRNRPPFHFEGEVIERNELR